MTDSRFPESDHQLKQLISVPTIWKENRKQKNQTSDTSNSEQGRHALTRNQGGPRRPTKGMQLQQSEVERNRLDPFGNHQLKQSISEPVWNLEP